MGYRRAEEILPADIIEIIQRYVDGENIYIPKKAENRRQWGSGTRIRQELIDRNHDIYADWQQKSIQRIVKDMKCEMEYRKAS